jgi:hypothetical protein
MSKKSFPHIINFFTHFYCGRYPAPLSVLPSVCLSVRPKIVFVAFFSATIDGRNLIFGHKLHIGIPVVQNLFLIEKVKIMLIVNETR